MYMQISEDFTQDLAAVAMDQDLADVLERVSTRLGFDHYALCLDIGAGAATTSPVLLHNYPRDWANIYVNMELGGRDPVRRACDRSFSGFSWGQIERLVPMTRDDRRMLTVGQECGIGDGFTVPRHLPGRIAGSCTFAVETGRPLPAAALHVTERVGALALASALSFTRLAVQGANPHLSDRQRECLLWTARGKTAAETAIILGISAETVTQHLKMARDRYDVHCGQSLILSALYDGLISFRDVFPPYDSQAA